MPPYASQQPAGFNNHATNIAIVGAGGRSGGFIVRALLKTGQHKITALTRPDSTNAMPAGIHCVAKAAYSDHAALVSALRGQDVLLITLSVHAAPESQKTLIDAAIEAGVRFIIPNEWGTDHTNAGVAADVPLGARIGAIREYIREKGGAVVGFVCGFWYEFSLAGTAVRYGFDFDRKELTLYDEGRVKMNTTSFPQLGRAVAAFLSLKMLPEDESDTSPSISQWENGSVCVSSFYVSQWDMFKSVLRVTGDKESDWKIAHEDVRERFAAGKAEMEKGSMRGFGKMLYARMFFPDAPADFNDRLVNDVLGLPEEKLDDMTKVALEMHARGEDNMIPA